MDTLVVILAAIFLLGVALGALVRSWRALLYPLMLAAVLILLTPSGALFDESLEAGTMGRIAFALLWGAGPALLGTLIGMGVRSLVRRHDHTA